MICAYGFDSFAWRPNHYLQNTYKLINKAPPVNKWSTSLVTDLRANSSNTSKQSEATTKQEKAWTPRNCPHRSERSCGQDLGWAPLNPIIGTKRRWNNNQEKVIYKNSLSGWEGHQSDKHPGGERYPSLIWAAYCKEGRTCRQDHNELLHGRAARKKGLMKKKSLTVRNFSHKYVERGVLVRLDQTSRTTPCQRKLRCKLHSYSEVWWR